MSQRLALALFVMAVPAAAQAAGGGHVVDDASVETPGTCHLEAWAARNAPDRGLANLASACTHIARPRLEIGGGLSHGWTSGADATTAGPALKLNLRPLGSGMGVGLTAAGAWNVGSGRLETAALVAPVSFAPSERLGINLNAGWLYGRTAVHRHEAFFGAQAEVQVAREISLMAEAFGRDHGRPGAQVGLRWTPGRGAFDLDLLVGRRVDGTSARAITIGLTARR